MAWFSAVLLFEAKVHDDLLGPHLCEESIRVIEAADAEEARIKAEGIGRQGEHSYKNEPGSIVEWRFVRTVEIQDLCEDSVSDGMEVHSRLFRRNPGG